MFVSPTSEGRNTIALFLMMLSFCLQAQGNSLAKTTKVNNNINLQQSVASTASIFKTFKNTKNVFTDDGNPSFNIKIESDYKVAFGCKDKTGLNTYTFTNNAPETSTGENFVTNIIVDLGASFDEAGFENKKSSLKDALNSSANLTKVYVNGYSVHNYMLEYVDGRFRIKFTELNDGEYANLYGFSDLDGDGYFDDLPEGGSFVVTTVTAVSCNENQSGFDAARILFNNNNGTDLQLKTHKDGYNLGNHLANHTNQLTFPTEVKSGTLFSISADLKAIYDSRAYTGCKNQYSELEINFPEKIEGSNISILDSYNRLIAFDITNDNKTLTLKIPFLEAEEQLLSNLEINGLKINCFENSNVNVDWSWRFVCEDCSVCKINWLQSSNSFTTSGCVPFDLAVNKEVNDEHPYIGDDVIFTISTENTSAIEAKNIVINDVLPSGYDFVSAISEDSYDAATGTWNIPSLHSKSKKTLKITAKVLATGNYKNTAKLISYEGGEDSIVSNNENSATTQPIEPKISLIQEGVFNDENNDSYAQAGETISYICRVKNIGNTPLYNIDITDDIITIQGSTITELAPNAQDESSFTGTYTITQNDVNKGLVLNRAKVLGYDLKDNKVTTFSDDLIDYLSPDCTDCAVTFLPQNQSVSLVKSYSLADTNSDGIKGTVGDIITYVFDITNTGSTTVTNLAINDPMLGVENMTVTPATLEPNETAQLILEYSILQEDVDRGFVENTASISGENPNLVGQLITDDSDSGTSFEGEIIENPNESETPNSDGRHDNNSTNDPTVTVLKGTIDLAVTKEVDNEKPIAGSEVIFTITITNNGTISAKNIEMLDDLPSGYEYISHAATSGAYSDITSLWTLQELNAFETQTLTMKVKVFDKGDYLNIAMVESYDGVADFDESNNEATAKVLPVCLTIYNEFSPNGDGSNETFTIDCIQNYNGNMLSVFNRWGNTVYEKSSYDNSWTGISNTGGTRGKELPSGTYYYVLKLGNGEDDVKGWLYINR